MNYEFKKVISFLLSHREKNSFQLYLLSSLIFGYFSFWYVNSYGSFTFNNFATDGRAFYFAAAAKSLVEGKLDVPPEYLAGMEGECLNYSGKCLGYFGLMPSIFRVPLYILGFPISSLGSSLFILIAYSVYLVIIYEIFTIGISFREKYRAITGVLVGLTFSTTPVFFLAGRSYLYEEAIIWGVVFSLLVILMLLRFKQFKQPKFLGLAILFSFFAIHSRVSAGLGCLFALSIFLLINFFKKTISNKSFQLGFLGVLLILMSFFTFNLIKFGTLLPDIASRHGGVLANAARAEFYAQNPQLDLSRFPQLFLNYFFPVFNFYPGQLIYSPSQYSFNFLTLHLNAKSIEQTEYFSPLPNTYPSLFLLGVIGLLFLIRRIDLDQLWVLGFSFPVIINCIFIGATQRYLSDFVPLFVMLSYIAINRLSFQSIFLRSSVLLLCCIQVLASYQITILFWNYSQDRPSQFTNLIGAKD